VSKIDSAKAVPHSETKLLAQIYYSVLTGQVSKAIELLNGSELDLSQELLDFKRGMSERFIKKTEKFPSYTGLLSELITIHRGYWIKVLTAELSNQEGKRELYSGLVRLASARGKNFGEFSEDNYSALGTFLANELEKDGIYSIIGTVSPLCDFIAWQKQHEKGFTVSLPEGSVEVKVMMMSEFTSFGWIGFATLGRKTVGGWPDGDLLYAVASKYDFESENFQVSYLAHEARHQNDLDLYPKLNEPELEYRAKLTELIMSKKSTLKLIDIFKSSAKVDRSSSHAHASYFVIRDIGKLLKPQVSTETIDWQDLSAGSIREAALTLLNESTAIMENFGAKEIVRFLELN